MIKIFSNTKSKIRSSSDGTSRKIFYRIIYFRCVLFIDYNAWESICLCL